MAAHAMGRGMGARAHPSENGKSAGASKGTDPCPPPPEGTAVVEPDPKEGGAEGQRGVIRLLLAGHFKGVADVRLRINFFDALTAVGFQEVRPAVTEKIESLSDDVNGRMEELLASGALDEEQSAGAQELLNAFNSAIQTLIEDFRSATDPGNESLLTGAEAAFKSFMDSLTALLGVASDESVTTEAEETDPDVPPPDSLQGEESSDFPAADPPEGDSAPIDLQAFLEQLAEAFTTAMADAVEMSSPSGFLPPLSPAQGNGAAYAKFLATYNELLGIEESAETDASETLDALV